MIINDIVIDKVPIIKIMNFAKKSIIAEYMENGKKISNDSKFLLSLLNSLPKGEELNNQIDSWMSSIDGILSIIEFSIRFHNDKIENDKIESFITNIIDKNDNGKTLKSILDIIYDIKDVELLEKKI